MTAALPRSRLRALLLASLALNLALLAAIGWHFAQAGRDPPSVRALHDVRAPSPRVLRAALPESRHALLGQVLDRHRGAIRGSVREVFAARSAVHDAMAAEPFDPDALQAAFAALRERDAAAAAAVQAMLAELMAQLAPEERERLAHAMHRHHHGRHPPRRP